MFVKWQDLLNKWQDLVINFYLTIKEYTTVTRLVVQIWKSFNSVSLVSFLLKNLVEILYGNIRRNALIKLPLNAQWSLQSKSIAAREESPLVCNWIRRSLPNRTITNFLSTAKYWTLLGLFLVDDLLALMQLWEVRLQVHLGYDLVLIVNCKYEMSLLAALQGRINTILI